MSHRRDIQSATASVIKEIDTSEFGNIVRSFGYFSYKFPSLIQEFPAEFEKFKDGGKEWSAFLREIRFWNEVGVEDMNRRLLQLCLRYIPKGEKFFKIENEVGSFTLPTRLDRLNKASLLAKELVYDIFPRIESHLNFRAETKSVTSNIIQGTINWTSTILESINRGEKFPTAFSCTINETNFDTPENILALTCLMKLQNDIDYLLYSKGSTDLQLNYKETNLLKDLKVQIDRLVSQTHMQQFMPRIEQFITLSLSSKPVKNLEEKTIQRIRQGIVKQKSYSDLIDWLEKYRSYYIKGIRDDFTNYPIEHEKTIDTIYELWIIFEMVTYFIEKKNIQFLGSLTREKNKFAGFKLQLGNKIFYLHYQAKYSGWTEYESEPDFTIQMADSEAIPIVMDPKNWSSSQTGEAIHKMLGYLLNLSHYGARVGILFFSRPLSIPRAESDPSIPYYESIREEKDKKFSFYTMYVNPNDSRHLETNFEVVFNQLQNFTHK